MELTWTQPGPDLTWTNLDPSLTIMLNDTVTFLCDCIILGSCMSVCCSVKTLTNYSQHILEFINLDDNEL